MSVEASALERSKLERKDRTELLAIVEAMGARASSRAKKADLIDQVLTLAGFSGSSEPSTPSPARPMEPVPSASDNGAAVSPADASTGAAVPAARAETVASPGQASETSETSDMSDMSGTRVTDDEQSRSTGDPSPAPNGGHGRREPDGTAASERLDRPARNDRGPSAGASMSSGSTADGGRPHPEADRQPALRSDDGETPNRRRRRRGRDRDRDRQGQNNLQANQQVQANPQAQQGQGAQGTGGQVQVEEASTFELVDVEGYLDLRDEGYGFLRVKGFLPSKNDVYVSVKQVRQLGLRKGDFLKGASRPASRNEKNPALLRIDSVNDVEPDLARDRRRFEDLTPLFPDERLRLELADDPGNMTTRIVDLIAPVGKGQRGLIVSPPKAGKTTIMKQIARSIEVNHPDVHLIVLLVDERPEEVTDMRRWLLKGEVAASTFDRPSDEHTQVAELTIERAKRMVEGGRDVCIILDGITRLARAYNLAAPATGRIMSGGVDSGALYPPKRFFGAARNIEEGGSLTILATALVETGSKMDEVIFEEFKGTGNMELRLDRRLAERRIYPAIDVDASSTRHEELLFDRRQLQMVWKLRRVLSGLGGEGGSGGAGLELLIDRMKTFKSNDEFLAEIGKAPSVSG